MITLKHAWYSFKRHELGAALYELVEPASPDSGFTEGARRRYGVKRAVYVTEVSETRQYTPHAPDSRYVGRVGRCLRSGPPLT
mgnify:CR=1 FL=1